MFRMYINNVFRKERYFYRGDNTVKTLSIKFYIAAYIAMLE